MAPVDYQQLPWWKKAFAWLDKENDRVLGYHGPLVPVSKEVSGELWLPAVLHASGSTLAEKAVQYCQCQYDAGKKTGGVECVTTSAVIARNIVRDEIAARQGKLPAPKEKTIQAFVDEMDKAGLRAWGKRLSSNIHIVGGFMHPVLQLPHALDMMAKELADTYNGRSFRCQLTSGNTLDDLIDSLRNNRPTLIHGIWNDRRVIDPRTGAANLDPANLLGGTPHTMPLVSYSSNDEWRFYDLGWKPGRPGNGFTTMTSDEVITFWGRCYPLESYTRRFSMTTITIDG